MDSTYKIKNNDLISPLSSSIDIESHLEYLYRIKRVQLRFMDGVYCTRKKLTIERNKERSWTNIIKNRNMQVNTSEVVECGNKLYYDINPNSKMDVPSMFYVRLEKEWVKWKESGSELSFYDFCKSQLNVA